MENLKSLRKLGNFSQSDMAAILNTTPQGYCRWELGQREMPYDTLKRLAKLFNCSIDYLLDYAHNTPTANPKTHSNPLPDISALSPEDAAIIGKIVECAIKLSTPYLKAILTFAQEVAPPAAVKDKMLKKSS